VTPLAFIRRWGISIASLVGGLLTLFVFRRELPHVRWIVGYIVLVWLLFAILAQVRQALEGSERRSHRFVVTAFDYTIQTLYHGLLLFVLPPYYASTTLSSPNVLFLLLLVALALLATFDPWYRVVVYPRPWMGGVFFVVSTFAALNVALPLVGIPPFFGLLLSAWLAVVALTPGIRRATGAKWTTALAITGLAALVATGLATAGRWLIPPAPLALARATLSRSVLGMEPVAPIAGTIGSAELRAGGIVAYTAVLAPAGLKQPIAHVWRHEGQVVNVVGLSPVRGGRREGFRTYSRKTAFPSNLVGRWTVDVVTGSGQLIGRLTFRVVP
jgi:hypothetical protein